MTAASAATSRFRIAEECRHQVEDIDSTHGDPCAAGQGGKDRYTVLPVRLLLASP